MLLWLRQRLPKKNILLSKLWILSGLLHGGFCFSLFFLYKSYNPALTVHVHAHAKKNDVIIRLLPFSQKKPLVKVAKKGSSKSKRSLAKKQTTRIAQNKKNVSKNNAQKTQAKKLSKPIQPKKITQIQKPKIVKQVKKVAQVKSQKEKIQKPVASKQIAQVPKVQSASEVKKIAQAEDKKQIRQESKKEIKQLVKEALTEHKEIADQEDVLYVTHKELQGIELQNALEQAIQKVWKAPVGIEESVESEVALTIGWQGKLVDAKVIKSSDILVFDVAVQDALAEMSFPKGVWGKEVKVAFKP
jgi:flagellar motor protein MotB